MDIQKAVGPFWLFGRGFACDDLHAKRDGVVEVIEKRAEPGEGHVDVVVIWMLRCRVPQQLLQNNI